MDESTWFAILKELFPSSEISVKESGFNWDAETVISDTSIDNTSYYQIADELYDRLINDNKKFSDWEYKFISDLYAVSEAKGHLTAKQKYWLDKLKEKHL